jgi:hypothetical protein
MGGEAPAHIRDLRPRSAIPAQGDCAYRQRALPGSSSAHRAGSHTGKRLFCGRPSNGKTRSGLKRAAWVGYFVRASTGAAVKRSGSRSP